MNLKMNLDFGTVYFDYETINIHEKNIFGTTH